jgi:hypothetical protein
MTLLKWLAGTSLLIFALIFGIAIPPSSLASAGYYPIHRGELLIIEACLPIKTTSPLKLQIANTDLHWKTVSTVSFKELMRGDCKKGYLKLKHRWKVNVSLGGGLRLFESKAKQSYFVWPDGIRVEGPGKSG